VPEKVHGAYYPALRTTVLDLKTVVRI
jgi:hypothetical protein